MNYNFNFYNKIFYNNKFYYIITLLLLLLGSIFIGSILYKNYDLRRRENLSFILYKASKASNTAHIKKLNPINRNNDNNDEGKAENITEADKQKLQLAVKSYLQEVIKAKIEPYYSIALMQLADLMKQETEGAAINNETNEFYKLVQNSDILALGSLAILNLKSIVSHEDNNIINNVNNNISNNKSSNNNFSKNSADNNDVLAKKNEINKIYYFSDKFLRALTEIKKGNLDKAKEDLYNIDSAADANPSIKELAKHVLSAYNL